ncbi:P22 phage major capsid protein family protein [Patulibacter sp. SYSU D01012]|uniref:P22 phage major capsid protein family protein n=1 Tax=Patulibacter sp. SYSU D01012 TaxID=2817381 RepID=UPI001B3114D8|nr:P22 phage major capsid protein family protein [Patulibacter sp. SYSU D01012]
MPTSTFIKAEKVVATSLGLLQRELTLPQLIWRDAVGDFAGVRGDTVSIRLPAYAPARKRALRSGATRVKDGLYERKIDVSLDTDIYKDVPISDEQLTLDIADFGAQVLNPVITGIAMQLEQEVADEINGANYATTIAHVSETDDAYETVVKARGYLNNAFVPLAGRRLLVGTNFEAELLTNEKFVDASRSGTSETLREALIGRIAGFDVYTSPAIAADRAYAFHSTAFVMSQRAPVIPLGVPWGATQAYQGFAIRTVRSYDPNLVEDRFIADAWVGTNTVTDFGHWLGDPAAGGKFEPAVNPDAPVTGQANAWANDAARLVRAVKITVA